MRLFGVSNQQAQFFSAYKIFESTAPFICRLLHHGNGVLPTDVLSLWEKHAKQFVLAAHRHIDQTLGNAVEAPRTQIDAVAAVASIWNGEEFDKAIHGLARVAIHYDVDGWAEGRADCFGVRTKECHDKGFGEVVRYLHQ